MARLTPEQKRKARHMVLAHRGEANSIGETQLDTRPGTQAVTFAAMRDGALGDGRLYPLINPGGADPPFRFLPDAVTIRPPHFPNRNFGAGNEPAIPAGVYTSFDQVRGVVQNAKIGETVWTTRAWANDRFQLK